MSAHITCPACGESEDLAGAPSPDGIAITCGNCGHEWLRDSAPQTCATCGGTDLELRPKAMTQYSRGTQLSIVGMSDVLLCRTCDEEMLEWSKTGRAVPPNYRSAALDAEAGRQRARSAAGRDKKMTP